jgi:hypothetical protein
MALGLSAPSGCTGSTGAIDALDTGWIQMAWSCGKSATGDWSATSPVGPYPLVVRTLTWVLVTLLELAPGTVPRRIGPDRHWRVPGALRWWRSR